MFCNKWFQTCLKTLKFFKERSSIYVFQIFSVCDISISVVFTKQIYYNVCIEDFRIVCRTDFPCRKIEN